MEVVSSQVHRRSPGNGRGAWKSVVAYRNGSDRNLIETYCDISGRDRYDDHVERFSSDAGQTWDKPRLAIPTRRTGGTVIRGIETFLDNDTLTGRVFRAYSEAVFHHDDQYDDVESSHRHSTLYVQYSLDGGETFAPRMNLSAVAADSPVFHPAPGVVFHPLLSCSHMQTLADGTLLFPVTRWASADAGALAAIPAGHPRQSICMAIGRWTASADDIQWRFGQPIPVELNGSFKGLSEASIALWDDGRLLAVARGENGGDPSTVGCKWWSISGDQGQSWSLARPLRDTQGEWVHSPETCCRLFRHSSGRLLLVTNLYDHPCHGGGPRHALHIAEIGADTRGDPAIVRASITTIDQCRDGESKDLALSNFSVYEDRASGQLCIFCPRAFAHRFSLEDCVCMLYRVAV